jgi:hypothetical protein
MQLLIEQSLVFPVKKRQQDEEGEGEGEQWEQRPDQEEKL